ncbi:protein of unknown function [Legionella hackeliae]|uniref:Uncharacterized protein n=1 Tax=Legionella hackeliae TaxID=449 RepID=A0A0A8UTA5_LEGHA|nr:protein of unknown function [Legionella hackeliae]
MPKFTVKKDYYLLDIKIDGLRGHGVGLTKLLCRLCDDFYSEDFLYGIATRLYSISLLIKNF